MLVHTVWLLLTYIILVVGKVQGGVCDVECVIEAGCRGPGPGGCNQCLHYLNTSSGQCIETCDKTTHFVYEVGTIECVACHEDCVEGCFGPLKYHCFSKCGDGEYQEGGDCRKCHKDCRWGCSGPENTVGEGACNPCPEPRAEDCYGCRHFYNVDSGACVETCDTRTHFVTAGKECGLCHEECEGCSGRTDKDCFKCRNQRRGGVCVSKCLNSEYVRNATCLECHKNCIVGCSGPLNTDGEGGCNLCPKPVFNKIPFNFGYCFNQTCYDVAIRCYAPDDTCPKQYFEDRIPLGLNPSEGIAKFSGKIVCFPCFGLCSKCTGYGFNPTVCQECSELYPNCSCPSGTYAENGLEMCMPCNEACKECRDQDSSCTECRDEYKYRVYSAGFPSDNGVFTCVTECPPYQPFFKYDTKYQNYCTSINSTVLEELISQQNGSKAIYTVIGITVVLLVLVILLGGFIMYLLARNKSNTSNFETESNSTLEDPEEQIVCSANIAPKRNKLRIIAESDVTKSQVLGSGAFGVVYRGLLLREGCNAQDPVAIKVLNPQNIETSTKELLQEASIMGRVNHVNLLPLLAICVTSNVMLVTELMPLGDLLHYLHKHNTSIKPKTMINWCLQIAKGMDFLEKHSLVHRDLAARNVLMKSVSRVKVTDFGLARAVRIEHAVYESRGGKLPVKWLALESLKTGIFTAKTDVWSYGVTVWEILTFGEEPYASCTTLPQLRATLDAGRRLGQPNSCSSDLYTVLATCWAENATSRPTFQELVDTFSMMSQDPGQFIFELAVDVNQSAPELLPRSYYHDIDEGQPSSQSYDNIENKIHSYENIREKLNQCENVGS